MKIILIKLPVLSIAAIMLLCSCQKKWTLETSNTKVVIGIDKNSSPCIYELSNPDYKWNWTKTPSVLQLPTKVVVRDGKTFDTVQWIFQEATENTSNGKTVTINFACKQVPGLFIQSIWWSASTLATGPIQHSWTIQNKTAAVVSLYPQLQGIDFNVQTDNPTKLWYISKDGGPKTDSIGIYKQPIVNGTDYNIPLLFHPIVWGLHGYIPLIILNSNDHHGLYVGWEWQTGNLNVKTDNNITGIKAGYSDGDDVPIDYLSVAAGNKFEMPSIYLGVYNGTVDDGTNGLKRWYWINKVPSNMRRDTTEPWTQYGGMFMYNADDPKLYWGSEEAPYKKGMEEKLSGIGFETVEIDYGWWGDVSSPRGFEADKKWWPNTMKTGGQLAHENGFKFNLYFCNLINWETKEILKKKWEQYGMDCWRDDMGRTPIPVLDWLSENILNFRYENCNGGGAWKDYATLRRASVQTLTDAVFSGLPLRQAFYDASYAIPPAQLSQCNHWVDWKIDSFVFEFRSGMQGAMFTAIAGIGPQSNPKNIVLPSDNKACIPLMKSNVEIYKTKLRPLIRDANLYHILPRPDGVNWDGIEYFNPNNQTGAVMLFKPDSLPDSKTIKLAGLDGKIKYALTFTDRPEQNTTLSGAELMEKGLNVNIKGKKQSEIIFFQAQ